MYQQRVVTGAIILVLVLLILIILWAKLSSVDESRRGPGRAVYYLCMTFCYWVFHTGYLQSLSLIDACLADANCNTLESEDLAGSQVSFLPTYRHP